VIALHSTNALLETGLRMCLPENAEDRDRIRCRAVRSLRPFAEDNREQSLAIVWLKVVTFRVRQLA